MNYVHQVLGLALCATILTGCGQHAGNSEDNSDFIVVRSYGNVGSITSINLKDGTQCAVLVGSSKGAIDCDWKTK
jgi:hypothetical protein